MKKLILFAVCFSILFFYAPISIQAQQVEWVKQHWDGYDNKITGLEIDSQGYIYISENWKVDNWPSPAKTYKHLAKYDDQGSLIWETKDTVVPNFSNGIAVYSTWLLEASKNLNLQDLNGNLLLLVDSGGFSKVKIHSTGIYGTNFSGLKKFDFSGNLLWSVPGSNQIELTNTAVYTDAGGIRKYDLNGNVLWTRSVPACEIISDNNGYIYIWGALWSSFTFGSTTLSNNKNYPCSSADFFLAKLDSLGNFLWAVQPPDSVKFFDATIDNDTIYISGPAGLPCAIGGELPYNPTAVSLYSAIDGTFIETKLLDIIPENDSPIELTRFIKKKGSNLYIGGEHHCMCGGGNTVYLAKISLNNIITDLIPNDKQWRELSIYPSPSNGSFTLNYSQKNNAPITTTIYDIKGFVLWQKEFSANTEFNINFDLSTYPKGTYLVEVVSNKKRSTKRIVVN